MYIIVYLQIWSGALKLKEEDLLHNVFAIAGAHLTDISATKEKIWLNKGSVDQPRKTVCCKFL